MVFTKIFLSIRFYRYVIDYYDGDLDPGSHRFVVMLLNCFSFFLFCNGADPRRLDGCFGVHKNKISYFF